MALQPVTSNNSASHTVRSIPVVLNGRTLEANRRIPLNLDWVEGVRVNTSAVERRAATQVARRTVKKETQAAWLLRAIACMDLTTLSGDDSADRVRRLCAKARNPLQRHIVEGLGIEDLHLTVGAVCVYHAFVETAVKALEGSGIPVAAVSAGSDDNRLLPSIARKSEVKLLRSPSTRVVGSHNSATSAERRLKLLSRQMLNRPRTTTSKKNSRNTAVR